MPGDVDHRPGHPRTTEASGGQHGRRQLSHYEDLACHAVDGGGEDGETSGDDQRDVHFIAPSIRHRIIRWCIDVRRMAAPTRTPRANWIEEGLRALAAGGPDAV